MPECSCGWPATDQICVGWVKRGQTFHRMFAHVCPECADEARVGREEARAS